MNEDQIENWQVKPFTVQGRLLKRLMGEGGVRACDVAASPHVVSVSIYLLRGKLKSFGVAIISVRDGTGRYSMNEATRAALNAGALFGLDHDILEAQGAYNARFKPAPGRSIHELTRIAFEARVARAAAGDSAALGPDAGAQIAAEVQRAVPSASVETVRSYLNTLGLAPARAEIGLRRDGEAFMVKPKTCDPWRPGDPKPAILLRAGMPARGLERRA